MRLNVADRGHIIADLAAHKPILALDSESSFEAEIDAMVETIKNLSLSMPDQVIATCAALYARCTEIRILVVRNESKERFLKFFRTQQLQPVMELIEFTYRAASRLIEVNRQEMDMAR